MKSEENKTNESTQPELTEEQEKALEFIKNKYIQNRPATVRHMITQFYTALNNDKELSSSDLSLLALDVMNAGFIMFEDSLSQDDATLNQRISAYNDLKKLIDMIFTTQYLNQEATLKRIAALEESKESRIIKPEN